uniref:Putative trypsin-like serine protease n=1 Tax=Anopheles nuneztovari TaxID=30067 RepID=A0A2M3YW23_9DIPT
MKQSVKLFLLAVLFCACCTKAQDELASDPGSDDESIGLPEETFGNGTNQADTNRAGRIVKGSVVSISDYPYVATVITTAYGASSYSTGVAISNTRVLTSVSNFLYASSIAVITVRVGSNYQDKEGTVFQTQNLTKHTQYDMASSANDVAVITIQGTFNGVPNVQPIAVHTTELDPTTPNLANCFLLGWGATETFSTAINLKKADMKLITDAACSSKFPPNPPSVQCVQSVTGFGCTGDSGAPFVCDNRLYGTFIFTTCNNMDAQATQKIAKLPSASIQSFLSPFLPVAKQPRKNYMTCPCTTC